MEPFWEKIVDILLIALKVTAIFIAIRVLFLVMDIPLPVPYVDDIFFYIMSRVGEVVPALDIRPK